MLRISNLRSSVEGSSFTKASAVTKVLADRSEGRKEILKGIDLQVKRSEIHVLMGPNGSGKSTLAQVIAGVPLFKVQSSKFKFMEKDLGKFTPDKRAKMGIFLAFQHPVEIPGVSVFNVLRKAKVVTGNKKPRTRISSVRGKPVYSGLVAPDLGRAKELRQELVGYLSSLKLSEDFLSRSLNEGFSGGEKKRSEILQMMALRPKLVILDEIDSGLDVDGLKIVAQAIKKFATENPKSSILLITHYARILKYLKPDFVHIMMDGKIIKSGKASLAQKIEKEGYERTRNVLEQRPIKDAPRSN